MTAEIIKLHKFILRCCECGSNSFRVYLRDRGDPMVVDYLVCAVCGEGFLKLEMYTEDEFGVV